MIIQGMAENFPKPRYVAGVARELPASGMEKLIVARIEVTDCDLRRLASKRQKHQENAPQKNIAYGRIFVVEPKSAAPEKKENVKASRVALS